MRQELKEATLAFITLLTSTSTLFCCTIPILLVMLGFGAVLATAIPYVPWWVTLSKHKFLIFVSSGMLLLISYLILRTSAKSCPADPILAAKCQKIRIWNWRLIWISFFIWITGFFFAYVLPNL